MSLHEAIRQAVEQFGNGIVAEERLANLLADFNGYEEYPAMKVVFKKIQKDGYGRKILEQYNGSMSGLSDAANGYVKQCADETGYKEDLVRYGFDCILFGLGALQEVNEPLSTGYDPKSKDGDVFDTMAEQLEALKKQYTGSLNKLAIKPVDILHDAPAYFSADAQNKLYAIEAKIAVLQQELGESDEKDWCRKKKAAKIAKFQKQKEDAVTKVLNDEKSEYSNLLSTKMIIPHGFLIKGSGYYDKDGLQALSKVEDKIKLSYYNLGNVYDNWCSTAKEDYLSKHKVSTVNMLAQLVCKIGLPIVIIVCVLVTCIRYTASTDDIKQFNQTISLAEQKETTKNYGEALQLLISAKKDYGGPYRCQHFENLADKRISEGLYKAMVECEQLIMQGNLLEANLLLKSLPEELVAETAPTSATISRVQSDLDKAVDKELNVLVISISGSNGHLDKTAKKRLNELLKIRPNDYWLNLINKKGQ